MSVVEERGVVDAPVLGVPVTRRPSRHLLGPWLSFNDRLYFGVTSRSFHMEVADAMQILGLRRTIG